MSRTLLILLALATGAQAQSVKLPAEVKGDSGEWVVIIPESKDGGEVKWKVSDGLQIVDVAKLLPGTKPAGLVVKAKAGSYQVWAWCAKGDVASDLAVCKVTIGAVPPAPPTPAPGPTPGPTPDPTPPNPDSPIIGPGFRVLFLYESAQDGNQVQGTRGQVLALYAGAIRDYLDAKCAKDASGNPERRIWDKDIKGIETETKMWQEAFKYAKEKSATVKLPLVLIANGKVETVQSIPDGVDATLALLKKHGGE